MADVQLENGFTRIANEILEEMARMKLSPTQYKLLMIIWRYTYGFNRKWHKLSLSFFSNATGSEASNIHKELKKLEKRKIIFQRISRGTTRQIAFNKNHDEWTDKLRSSHPTHGEMDHKSYGESNKTTYGETDQQELTIYKHKDIDHQLESCLLEYESHFGKPSNRLIRNLNQWINESKFQEPEQIIYETLKRIAVQEPENPASYVQATLKRLHSKCLYTLADVRGHNIKFDQRIRKKQDENIPMLTEMFRDRSHNIEPVRSADLKRVEEIENQFPF